MARHANMNWTLPEGQPDGTGGRTHQWEVIHTALLMDLRDELRSLNALLHCQNFVTLPRELRGLRRDLKAQRKEKKA